ncbi:MULTISPECIES: terminase TerL endonuclease subunit [unclassified Azospirillum]|uniref:terminase large subunit n=1 Tax=unclassified Azospirillum TaxID=2630922 RepID=UPI000D6478D6|nr:MULTISPECIES: terminase TerL endonuclease subunit [unclassified Azospirillum]
MAIAKRKSGGGAPPSAPTGRRDYIAIANGYIADVVSGKIPACKWVIAACERQKRDLARQGDKAWPYRFDEEKASRICRFVENMPHTKGKWAIKKAGDPRSNRLRLEPWQVFRLTTIFGWVKKETGTRRFRRAYNFVPRKNGKSAEVAAVGLYMLAADGEYGAEVYCGATNEVQAWEVFRPAKLTVERETAFSEKFGLLANAANINRLADMSRFEPIIGKPGDGASPSFAIVDEYHEHQTNDLYDTMETGMGAREQPMMWVVTTAGDNIAGPCYDMDSHARKVLEGLIEDEELFAIIYTIDDGDDWKSEMALIKANPNYGVSVSAEFLRSKQAEAVKRTSKQGVFKTKHLNLWVQSRQAWMNMDAWLKSGDCPDIEEYSGQPCRLAFDLASRTDIAARAQLFTTLEDDGKTHFWLYTKLYMPSESELFDKVPALRHWADEGHIELTDGNEIDLTKIETDAIGEPCGGQREGGLVTEFEVTEAVFDPWQATQMRQNFQREASSVQVIEFRALTQNFSPAMKELEAAVLSGRFHHDNNPVMNWMMSNVTVKPDANDNVFPRKEKHENKIDGPVAAMMAIARAMTGDPDGTVPDDYDLPVWG